MSAWTDAEIDAEIASLKAQLAENTAALAKARTAQQQSMDTGQTRVSVMRQQITQLQGDRRSILEQIDHWCALKSTATSGAHNARPGW